jgi:hypothetical protein
MVAATAISGMRMQGGQVFAGQSYEVGERGREVFTPTTNGVISSSGGGGGGPVQVQNNIYNYTNASVETRTNETGGSDVYVRKSELDGMIAAGVSDPYSRTSKALRTTTSATRRL